mgnify:FL=1
MKERKWFTGHGFTLDLNRVKCVGIAENEYKVLITFKKGDTVIGGYDTLIEAQEAYNDISEALINT